MWKNIAEMGKPQMTIWRMRTEFWIPKTTKHSLRYVILNAFPLKQWMHKRLNVMLYSQ